MAGNERGIQITIKRAIDIVGSAVLLVLTLPVLVAAIILIRCTLGTPVLFCQERAGYLGRVFVLYKLRTMTEDRDIYGVFLPADRRLTMLGRWLRRSSVDELPQLWNVLKGDMSLIGPRPLLACYLQRYNSSQRRRHEVRPGITGWAQISGRNSLTWEDKFNLDVLYVHHWSLLLDLKIAVRTIRTVFRAEGTAETGSPAEFEFTGSPELEADRPIYRSRA
ncbi:MAG: sugar transferase [Bryobacteraceae bacterium]